MNLARPPEKYDPNDQAQMRAQIAAEDSRNVKVGGRVLLRSPNGALWRLAVADDGTLSAEPT